MLSRHQTTQTHLIMQAKYRLVSLKNFEHPQCGALKNDKQCSDTQRQSKQDKIAFITCLEAKAQCGGYHILDMARMGP